jgi:hypothetical protein
MQETETQRLLHDETVRALERRWVEVKGRYLNGMSHELIVDIFSLYDQENLYGRLRNSLRPGSCTF